MYAVVETGGKQYKVSEGDVLYVEKLDVKEDAKVILDKVLAIGTEKGLKVGTPYVKGAAVEAKALKNGKAKKILVMTYKPKKNEKRKMGHRQPYTKLEILKISEKAAKATEDKAEKPAAEKKAAVPKAEAEKMLLQRRRQLRRQRLRRRLLQRRRQLRRQRPRRRLLQRRRQLRRQRLRRRLLQRRQQRRRQQLRRKLLQRRLRQRKRQRLNKKGV